MKSDYDVDYEYALAKRAQLEAEIGLSEALPSEKSNMQHTLSKLWIALGNIRDRAIRRSPQDPT